MRLNAQPKNAFPSPRVSWTNIGYSKTIDTTGGICLLTGGCLLLNNNIRKEMCKMNEKDIQTVSALLDNSQGFLGYAYLYPNDGSKRKEFVFELTPEHLANFIGAHQFDAEKMVFTNLLDRLILNTSGGFIMTCPNQELCRQIIPILAPIQMGEIQAKEIPMVTREQFEAYGRYEDEAATMAEYGMEL